MNYLVILNTLVLSLTDMQHGKSILLLLCIFSNLLFSLRSGIDKNYYFLFFLPLYILVRQIFAFQPIGISFDKFNFLIFYSYFISFILVCSVINNKNSFILSISIVYIVLNFIFGLLDFLNINLPIIHTDINHSGRFRGLSIEPNNLAIPLALILAGFFIFNKHNKLSYTYIYIIYFQLITMIVLSSSKAAYLLIIIFSILIFISSINYTKVIIFSFLLILSCLIIYNYDLLKSYTFFTSFILLINMDMIINAGMDEFIRHLASLDQFQSGSFGTRLATFYGSLSIFPNSLFFGYGEGYTHLYLSDYIFNNNLQNSELIDHLNNNPHFITDKTFIIKFLLDYGFIGALIFIYTMYNCIIKLIPCKLSNFQIFSILQILFLTQNQFILVFIIIFLVFTIHETNSSLIKVNE
jgi:hypothetical protein